MNFFKKIVEATRRVDDWTLDGQQSKRSMLPCNVPNCTGHSASNDHSWPSRSIHADEGASIGEWMDQVRYSRTHQELMVSLLLLRPCSVLNFKVLTLKFLIK